MQGYKYTSSKPIHVNRIVFSNGEEISNTDIMFFDDFIIVAHDTGAPTFYNKSLVDKMEGVEANSSGQKLGAW